MLVSCPKIYSRSQENLQPVLNPRLLQLYCTSTGIQIIKIKSSICVHELQSHLLLQQNIPSDTDVLASCYNYSMDKCLSVNRLLNTKLEKWLQPMFKDLKCKVPVGV